MLDPEVLQVPITIGVVADTHLRAPRNRLPAELVAGLDGVDLVVHAGDVTSAATLEWFEQFAPVRAVAGNNEEPELARLLPPERFFQAGDVRIVLIHGHNDLGLTARRFAERRWADRADLVIFGHSHRALNERVNGCLLFNPGSPTQRRWEPRHSFGVIRIDDGIEAALRFF